MCSSLEHFLENLVKFCQYFFERSAKNDTEKGADFRYKQPIN